MVSSVAQALAEGAQFGERYTLTPPRRAPQGSTGSQLGRLAGESLEFMDHREYQPGDDLRRLDWAAYARSDKMIVKLFRQEVCPHVDLVLDGSRSMALESTEKLRGSLALTAALAVAAANAGYSFRTFLTGRGCVPVVNGDEHPTTWQGLTFDAVENPLESFRKYPPAWRPRGMRILISDLLWPGEPLELLTSMTDRAATTYVVRMSAAADATPPHQGNIRVVDSETGEVDEVYFDATAQARYRNAFQRHHENWLVAARRTGTAFVSMIAETFCVERNLMPLVEAGMLSFA